MVIIKSYQRTLLFYINRLVYLGEISMAFKIPDVLNVEAMLFRNQQLLACKNFNHRLLYF